MTADIVAAHVSNNSLSVADMAGLITSLFNALSGLGEPKRPEAPERTPAIPSKANHKILISHDKQLYRQGHKIESMFGKLEDWRRIHTRYE